MMASLTVNDNKECFKKCPILYNILQDKKITQKAFLVVGLCL